MSAGKGGRAEEELSSPTAPAQQQRKPEADARPAKKKRRIEPSVDLSPPPPPPSPQVPRQPKRDSAAEAEAELQYRKMGAAFASVALQILSLCLDGQTVAGQRSAMDPEACRRTDLRELLGKLQERSTRQRRAEEERRCVAGCCSPSSSGHSASH